jgi:putative transcriptional regulator
MTVPHHHLDHATLLRYAAGDLDEAFAAIVSSHIAMCGKCRQALRDAEAIGGDLLEQSDAATLSGDALQRLLGAIAMEDGDRPVTAPPQADETAASDIPAPLRRYIGPSLSGIPWKRLAPGVSRHKVPLTTDTGSALYLLKIAPGKAVPEHGHGGAEMTLILSGSYCDDLGRFCPGDVADLDEHVEHQPKVEPGAPCICIVATETTTRFKGFFSRLLQPLVGI